MSALANQTIPNNVHVGGRLSAHSFAPPAECIGNAAVAANAAISGDKLMHRHVVNYSQAIGSAVVEATDSVYQCHADDGASVAAVGAAWTGAIPTTTYSITITIKRARAGSTLVDVATVTLSHSNALYEPAAATLDGDLDLVAGDVLIVDVVTNLGNGAMGEGLNVSIQIDEQPQ